MTPSPNPSPRTRGVPSPAPKDPARVPTALTLADIRALTDPISHDAREARDGMIKLTAAFAAQDTNARLDSLTSAMREQHNALRQDVVLAITNVRTDLKDVDIRVEDLEADKDQRAGGSSLLRLLRTSAAWLITLAVSIYALLTHHTAPK